MNDRTPDGRFAKGWKGGPGRPKNTREDYRAILAPHMPELLQQLIVLAKGGDMLALRMIFDRMYPAHSAQSDELLAEIEEVRAMVEAPEKAA